MVTAGVVEGVKELRKVCILICALSFSTLIFICHDVLDTCMGNSKLRPLIRAYLGD